MSYILTKKWGINHIIWEEGLMIKFPNNHIVGIELPKMLEETKITPENKNVYPNQIVFINEHIIHRNSVNDAWVI